MNRIAVGFIGLCALVIGIGTLVNPNTYHHIYGITINYENVKWPLFFVTTIFGIICIYFALSKKIKKNCHWICPQCEEVVSTLDSGGSPHCSKCENNLVKLKGFYDNQTKG